LLVYIRVAAIDTARAVFDNTSSRIYEEGVMSSDDDAVTKFLDQYPSKVRELASQLRALVRDVAPDAIERVYTGWKTIRYSLSERAEDRVCYISPFNEFVRLGFDYAPGLPDAHHLLEGTGARMRHIKISADDPIRTELYRPMLQAAFEQARPRQAARKQNHPS
jgi:hypothetical protein